MSDVLTLQLSALDRVDVALDVNGLIGDLDVALLAEHDQIVQRIFVLFVAGSRPG